MAPQARRPVTRRLITKTRLFILLCLALGYLQLKAGHAGSDLLQYVVHKSFTVTSAAWAAGAAAAMGDDAGGGGGGGAQRAGLREVFATLWSQEMHELLKLENDGPLPPTDAPYRLADLAEGLKDQGIDFLFVSFKWQDQEPTQGKYRFEVQDFVQREVCGRGLKMAVVIDAQQTPKWVLQKFPNARQHNSRDSVRSDISFNDPNAMQLMYQWQDAALERLAELNASCIHSIQPSFNNEYETKYTQEGDCFQDYSPPSINLFRAYMRSVHGSIQHWNARWRTTFANWAVVRPPPTFQHGVYYNSSISDLFYYDFQHFRHLRLHAIHEECCQRATARGFRCTLHFGEFFSGSDAIYASGAVFTLAASPWVDYVVLDSNFMVPGGEANDLRIVQLLLSALKPYGKPAFFEGAFERFADPAMHRRAVQLTLASGAHGLGFTNWLGKAGGGFVNDTLGGVSPGRVDSLDRAPAIAILTPYRSYYAYKGLPFVAPGKLASHDPQQDRLFRCLDAVAAAVPSTQRLQIFAVPSMLLTALERFQQVWYLEPDVLLSGDAKAIAAVQRRAAEYGVPVHACVPRAEPALIVPECCPTI